MKHITHIIFGMFFMLCLSDTTAVAQVNSSDEFFTLYFKDGTSRNFYTGDITAITHSNIDLDGTIYEEPVVQEIRMGTEVERYRLADIEEMSFERLNIPFDVRASVEKWEIVSEAVNKMLEGKSIYELAEHKVEIENLDNVVAVAFRENLMEVTLDDGTVKKWYEPIETYELEEKVSSSKACDSFAANGLNAVPYHTPANGMKVLIANQLVDSEIYDFVEGTNVLKALRKDLEQKGFCVEDSKPFTPHLFPNMTEYDVIVFYTHGDFDGNQHWLLTKTSLTKTEHSNYWDSKYFCLWENHKDCNGKSYLAVSESWIKEVSNLKQDAIIISSACQSLKGNDNLAESFIHNGASFFVGYDDTVIRSYKAINMFVSELAKDKTIKEAYDLTCEEHGEFSYIHPDTWALHNAKLRAVTAKGKEDYVYTTCFNHPSFATAKPEECNIGETSAYLGVKIQNLDGLKNKYDGLQEIGILYSTRSYGWQDSDVKKITIYSWNWKDGLMLGQTFTLKMETEYYYRAYVKTGDGDIIYGDIEKFVTHDEEARAELKKIYDQIGLESWGWFKPDTPIERWNNVYMDQKGYEVIIDRAKYIPDLVLEDLKRIYSISLPYDLEVFSSATITNCSKLEELQNLKTKNLKVQSCDKLDNLITWDNDNYFETIDISNCDGFEDISFFETDLRSLKVADCSSLKWIKINGTNLSSIEVVNCPNLEEFDCRDNEIEGTLNLSSDKLREFDCSNNKFTSLNLRCPLLKKLDCYNNEITGTLVLSGLPSLEVLDCKYNKINRLVITSLNMDKIYGSDNPIDQTYESIPNWEDIEFICDKKYGYAYIYTEADDFTEEEKREGGWTELYREPTLYYYNIYYYRYNYDDHHGFYHKGEPNDEKYWPFH